MDVKHALWYILCLTAQVSPSTAVDSWDNEKITTIMVLTPALPQNFVVIILRYADLEINMHVLTIKSYIDKGF